MLALRLVGSALGLGAVAALLITGRPESEPPRLGATVAVRAASGGAIEARVPGGGPALATDSLRPGAAPLKGRLVLINHGSRPIRVQLSATTPAGSLIDPAVAAALVLRAGPEGELGPGSLVGDLPSPVGVVIPGGARRQVPLALELDPEAPAGALAGEHLALILVPLRQVL